MKVRTQIILVLSLAVLITLPLIKACSKIKDDKPVQVNGKLPVKVTVDGVKIAVNKPNINYNKKTGIVKISDIKSDDGRFQVKIPDIKIPESKNKIGVGMYMEEETAGMKFAPIISRELIKVPGAEDFCINIGLCPKGIAPSIGIFLQSNTEVYVASVNGKTMLGLQIRF